MLVQWLNDGDEDGVKVGKGGNADGKAMLVSLAELSVINVKVCTQVEVLMTPVVPLVKE